VLATPWCCIGTHASETTASTPPCHEAHAGGHRHSAPPDESKPAPKCAMRAACGGQAAALFAALSTIGILQDGVAVADSPSAAPLSSIHTQPIPQFHTPDAPPPRANLATL
jgi:hypothetical protein